MSGNGTTYDTIVVGLGAMGAATLYQLALRGQRVLGIDQFASPHAQGSSHGETRITRQAVGEGPAYVPLVLRSHELWRDLEKQSGRALFSAVGGVVIGDPAQRDAHHGKPAFVSNTISTAIQFGIEHDVLDARALRKRFPQFAVSDNEVGYYEPGAGFVRPEECIRVQLALAEEHGAEIVVGRKVDAVESHPAADGVVVRVGETVRHAKQCVVTAGPWIHAFFEDQRDYFRICRQVLYWFHPQHSIEPFRPEGCPIFIWNFGRGDGIYGFPAIDGPDGGVKIAREEYSETTTPEQVRRTVSPEEIDHMFTTYVRDRLPLLSSQCVKAVSCVYTVTPDWDFVIQRHPRCEPMLIASPCSGHGFKHSAAIGEAIAQLVVSGRSEIDLSMFRLKT